jgi:aspartyl/asparaginyl beta-hydroxylase (cupin superfamily)
LAKSAVTLPKLESTAMPPPQDDESDEAALSRLLEREPHSVSAHVRLGELRAREGKDNLARHYYRKALDLAQIQGPGGAAGDVVQAEAALAEIEGRIFAVREAVMIERGFPPVQWSPRFAEALDLAASRHKRSLSDPTDFDFPGLPAIPFFDPAQFSWAPAIEAATADMREELLAELSRDEDQFRSYLQGHSVAAEANRELRGKTDWSILALCENSWVAPAVVQRFPRTWQAVLRAPLPGIYGWGPTVVLSRLKAGAHIAAHNGMFNSRLICHLPLIVPPGCRFRVGSEAREWEVGKLMIFDDTIEHEAWNDGAEDRVVLIFDIWRPELTDRERAELTALFHV